MALHVVRVPVLEDNYSWIVHDEASGKTLVVDPGEAEPVLEAAAANGWAIDAIWITHWHRDHTGGVMEIKRATGAQVVGPAAEQDKFEGLDEGVGEGETLALGAHGAMVLDMPGHTAGHIVFHFRDDAIVFTGDTLFALGCGRLFEGTPEQMYANMQRFAAMPAETAVYCGHEYTQANGRFALTVEPDNAALQARMEQIDAARTAHEPTIPTTIEQERATNPFLRATSLTEFARRRRAKDEFRS